MPRKISKKKPTYQELESTIYKLRLQVEAAEECIDVIGGVDRAYIDGKYQETNWDD